MSFYDKIKVYSEDMDFIIKSKYLDLNDFEDSFIESIYYNCAFRGNYHLSEKQKNVFDKILAKAKAADPGVNSIAEKYREIFKRFNKTLSKIDEDHLAAYNHVYKENDNIKIGFEMMLKNYGIKGK